MLMAHLTAQGRLVNTNALFSLQRVTAGGRHYKRPTGVLEQHKKNTLQDLEQPCTTYSNPMDIDRDQGTYFTGHEVEKWANKSDIHCHFHLPYNPTAARLIERINGLFKQQLRWETCPLKFPGG